MVKRWSSDLLDSYGVKELEAYQTSHYLEEQRRLNSMRHKKQNAEQMDDCFNSSYTRNPLATM